MHFALISFISAGFVTGVLWFTAFFRKPLPPGPSSLLIRRNASKDEPEEPWRKYASWAVKHGSDVISLPSPTQNMIVIDNLTAATELLERRSRIYSERPLWPMAVLMGRQNNVGFSPYGPRLKLARRLLHDNMSKNVEHVWFPAVETCVRRILAGFIERRETRRECVRDEIADMLMNFAYGHNVDAQMSELMHAAGQRTNKGLQPGTWLVNYIPLLRYIPAWMPGAGFKRFADDSRAIFDDITRIPFEQVRRDIAARSDTTSYVRRSLESELVISEDDAEVVRASAGSIHDAGLGTSFSLILSFFAVLSRRPDIQERLYAEIVAALGPGRLPTWDDRAALPFLDAVTAELARLHPPIPLMSRSVREDDVYKGYRIPGQSWIMTNLWSMLHDPHVYPQPEEFIPDRFIKSDKGSFPRDPRTIIFGFGRRICPGAQLANVLLFLLFSRTIALFKIKAQNPEKPIKYTAGLIPMPLPFECTLVPRVENANELIMESKS